MTKVYDNIQNHIRLLLLPLGMKLINRIYNGPLLGPILIIATQAAFHYYIIDIVY